MRSYFDSAQRRPMAGLSRGHRAALREAALRNAVVCNAGHLLAGENVIVRKNGRRRCALCERKYQREWVKVKRTLKQSEG